jgi:hypothetical protein
VGKNSPTKLSLEKMRKDGYVCQVVEKWNPFARVRQDLFGFIDILCIHDEKGIIVGVQSTTTGHANERVVKIRNEPRALIWLRARGKIVVHGWKKGGKRSEAPGKWICTVVSYPTVPTRET